MAKQFFDSGIVTESLLWKHPSRPSNLDWYPPGTVELNRRPFRGPLVERFVESIDVCLFYETPFDWTFLDYCRNRGVKTALVPMYEWMPERLAHKPDLMLCPSLLDLDYFPDGVFLPIPVDPGHWKLRTRADRFLHNAGNIGCQEHKGTRQLLQAIPHVQNPEFRITIRAQAGDELRGMVRECGLSDPRVTFQYEEIPYERLWDDHDVLVAPEKLNGLSLPLQEGRAAGMVVMASDRYPANTWLPREPLIPVERYIRSRQSRGCLEFDLAVIEPRDIAAKIDEWVGRDIEEISRSGREWAEAHSWEAMEPKYLAVLEELCKT